MIWLRKYFGDTSLRGVRIAAICAAMLFSVFVCSIFIPLEKESFAASGATSLRIYDKHGILLREVLSEHEGRGRWCTLREISPALIHAVVATEDARFYSHPGVDPVSLVRAMLANVRARRIVSGGSTITMQVIRNVYHSRRALPEKLREAWYALRLERMMSKDEILEQYLNRIPFGNQTFGIDAAARLYLSKPAGQLSIAEAAFLAGIPNSPSLNDPYRSTSRVRARQLYVLARMESAGYISSDERDRASDEPIVLTPRSAQFKAPHFTTMILNELSDSENQRPAEIYTSLDYRIQRAVELLLRAHLARLKKHNISNGAAVVIDNQTHSVIALVGSKDFFDAGATGQVNGALALRQGGSTLKPFTYGMALENGMTAADLLADIPRESGDSNADFLPENYDKKYHGPVRLRTALACSYNIPAVRTLERFGEEMLLQKLHAAGFASLQQPSSFYGVGLTLGNGEVTLLELCNAYSTLANKGEYHPTKYIDSVKSAGGFIEPRTYVAPPDAQSETKRIFSRQVAYILTDILSDQQARAPAFGVNSSLHLPFVCAAKTGTSKDYKDNWTIGYTPRYSVAIWVGNFNAAPMKLVSGITGAAPLFRDIMMFLHQSESKTFQIQFSQPEGIRSFRICPRSGKLVGNDCPGEMRELFISGTEPREACAVHRALSIDIRSGFPATRFTPREFVQKKVYEFFPPEFDQWAANERLPKPPAGFAEGVTRTTAPLVINTPVSGDVFKIDPVLRSEYQTITVETLVASGIETVSLWLNGDKLSPLQPPYRFRLALASLPKGNNVLMVKGRKGTRSIESEPVHVSIQ